jgi:hypothetical protein
MVDPDRQERLAAESAIGGVVNVGAELTGLDTTPVGSLEPDQQRDDRGGGEGELRETCEHSLSPSMRLLRAFANATTPSRDATALSSGGLARALVVTASRLRARSGEKE